MVLSSFRGTAADPDILMFFPPPPRQPYIISTQVSNITDVREFAQNTGVFTLIVFSLVGLVVH